MTFAGRNWRPIAIAAKRSRLWGVPEAGAVPSTPFVLAVQVLVLVFFISGLLFFIYLLFVVLYRRRTEFRETKLAWQILVHPLSTLLH